MEPGAALEEYGMMVLKVRALYKLVFDNRLVASFLRGTPGIEAWAMLGKAQYHAFETCPTAAARYDTVIVDAPATGHGLELLRVPKVIMDVVPPGLLRREAERAWDLFTDPARSGVLIVTLPEDMPANEAIERRIARCAKSWDCRYAGWQSTCCYRGCSRPRKRGRARARSKRRSRPTRTAALDRRRHAAVLREQAQAEHLARLQRDIPVHCYELPMLFAAMCAAPSSRRSPIACRRLEP